MPRPPPPPSNRRRDDANAARPAAWPVGRSVGRRFAILSDATSVVDPIYATA